MLTQVEEAIVVAFRRRTLLPLDDVLGCLRETIPRLTRSALHRCLQRHRISRLPTGDTRASRRGRFPETTIGYVHVDVSQLRLAKAKLHMFLAIDRVSKFTYIEFHERATMAVGAAFLRNLVAALPYAIHTVLTDNGVQFADLPQYRSGPTAQWRGHAFDRVCVKHGIKHRLTKPYHPWTNGQAERMNRTVKDATVKAYHYEDLEGLKAQILAFVAAYNFAKHLKALRWRTPFQAICDAWTKDPTPFKLHPHHLIPGPYTFEDGSCYSDPANAFGQAWGAAPVGLSSTRGDRSNTRRSNLFASIELLAAPTTHIPLGSTMAVTPTVDQKLLDDLVRRIIVAVHPNRIVLFGSAARGQFGPDSDLDVLVVMPDGVHRRETAETIYRGLAGMRVAKDIVVVTESDVRQHGGNPSLVLFPALREGRDLYRVPG